uniref:Uncharacterized protein n=1 Tax=Romanomermis culicivorax TaxID=13658 RepID=A0A915IYJ6_ROMCU
MVRCPWGSVPPRDSTNRKASAKDWLSDRLAQSKNQYRLPSKPKKRRIALSGAKVDPPAALPGRPDSEGVDVSPIS